MFCVAGQSKAVSDDQLRAISRSGSFRRAPKHLQAVPEIGSIQGMAFDAVPDGPIDQIFAGELSTVWRRIGVLIVHHHDNQRQFFDRRQVDSLMESAGGGPAVADGRGTDRGSVPLKRLATKAPATTEMSDPRWLIIA